MPGRLAAPVDSQEYQRARRLGPTGAQHLAMESVAARRRGRLTAAAALMLAAENF